MHAIYSYFFLSSNSLKHKKFLNQFAPLSLQLLSTPTFLRAREQRERELLKNMTDAERAEYDRLNPKRQVAKEKGERAFLQKYYHKGAFFQEEGDDK